MEDTKTYKIKCVICGAQTGEIELPPGFVGDANFLTNADMGIADSRCDNCLIYHGAYTPPEPEPDPSPVEPSALT